MHLFYIDNAIGFVAVLAVILFFTKTIGLAFRHFGLPEVLGFIIAGILIGPAIFGDFCGFTIIGFEEGDYYSLLEISAGSKGLDIFSKIGVLFLMFCAGLETNVKELKNTGLASFLIALAGVCVPLVLGFVISLPFGNLGLGVNNLYKCLFVGTILTATSVAITVSVLKELGKMNTKLGTTIVSAAIIDDVIGIVLLSVVTGFAKGGNTSATNKFDAFKATPYGTVIMIVAFFVVAVALGFVAIKVFKWMDKRWASTHRISMYSLVMCFGYSFLAEKVFGVADITGAFLAGAVLSTVRRASRFIDQQVDVDTYTIFAPVFFANIGISSISFASMNPKILIFALIAVVAGLVGKIVGCGAVCKAFKYSWRESAVGGVGMMARGEVALIVTSTAIGAGLPEQFMIMTVFLILVSSILTPILLKVLYKGVPPEPQKMLPEIDPDD